MALGEWLRQVMVETSALKHRAESVARLMASRQLLALETHGTSHGTLLIERESLRDAFLFLAGPKPRATELFRGNAVDLVLERKKLLDVAARVDVVAAPWKFLGEPPDAIRWFPFLDAALPLAGSLDEQLAVVPHRKRLLEVADDPAVVLRVSRARKDYQRFWDELDVDGPDGERQTLEAGFRDGGAIALVLGRGGKRLLAGALLLIRKRGALTWHRSGYADGAALTATQHAHRTAALERAVLDHARAAGVAQLDFAITPSQVTHPAFVQRRRLGCTFSPTPSSPALMLTVRPALRASLFAKFPLLTGEPGDFAVQFGCWGTKDKALRAVAKALDVPGCDRVVLSAGGEDRARAERVLREEVPRLTVLR